MYSTPGLDRRLELPPLLEAVVDANVQQLMSARRFLDVDFQMTVQTRRERFSTAHFTAMDEFSKRSSLLKNCEWLM